VIRGPKGFDNPWSRVRACRADKSDRHAFTVYCLYRSTTGIVGSNPTRGTDVCIFSVFGLCRFLSKDPMICLSTRFRNTINKRPWTALFCRAKQDECFHAIRGSSRNLLALFLKRASSAHRAGFSCCGNFLLI
jgi:hypothetical protein